MYFILLLRKETRVRAKSRKRFCSRSVKLETFQNLVFQALTVLALSGIKLLDVPNAALGVILVATLVSAAATWFVTRRRARAHAHALPATQAVAASRDSAPG